MPRGKDQDRFVMLDGLRGIAAAMVVQRHVSDLFFSIAPSSYLAVDLFFGLSGFVIAHAYGAKLQKSNLSFFGFMFARLLRLYPLYLLALLVMGSFYVTAHFWGMTVWRDQLAISMLMGLLFLPSPVTLSFNSSLFLVHPAWSLFNELVANAAYGLTARILTTRRIFVVLAISIVGLLIASYQFGTLDVGYRWSDMYGGIARVFFSFFIGVFIYRYRQFAKTENPLFGMLCAILLVVALSLPMPETYRALYDFVIITVVFPLMIFTASAVKLKGISKAIASFLGSASYAIYVLHVPLGRWTEEVWPRIFHVQARDFAPSIGVVFLVLLIVLGWSLDRYYDTPLRKAFSRRFLSRNEKVIIEAKAL